MAGEWKFEWIDTWDQIWSTEFLDRWRELYASCPSTHVFASPAVVGTWQEFVSGQMDVSPRFAWGRHVSGATALFPLALVRSGWRQAGCRSLVSAGYDFDYQGPILKDVEAPAVLAAFWRDLLDQAKRRFAHDIDEIAIRGIQRIPELCDLNFQTQCETTRIDLTDYESIEVFMESLPPGFPKELRRYCRRLEEIGPVSLKIFKPHEVDAALDALEPFWQAYREHWNAWAGHKRFWKELVVRCLPQGMLWFSVLACGDRQISWHLGFVDKGTFYGWNAAFDREMARYSPGAVHLLRECEHCIACGMKRYDFLRGSEEYKLRWPVKASPLYRLCVATPASFSCVRRECRHVLDRLRPYVRRMRSGEKRGRWAVVADPA